MLKQFSKKSKLYPLLQVFCKSGRIILVVVVRPDQDKLILEVLRTKLQKDILDSKLSELLVILGFFTLTL